MSSWTTRFVRLVLVALPCRVESRCFPGDFRRGSAAPCLDALQCCERSGDATSASFSPTLCAAGPLRLDGTRSGRIGPIRFTRKLGACLRPSIAGSFSTIPFSKREQHDRPQLVDGELSRSARVNPQLTEAWQTVESRLNRNELSPPKGDIPGMFYFSASRSASSTERCLQAQTDTFS